MFSVALEATDLYILRFRKGVAFDYDIINKPRQVNILIIPYHIDLVIRIRRND